jgi:predicted permease
VAALAVTSVVLPVGRWVFFSTLPPALADLVRVAPLAIDIRVFGFAFAVAAGATILCALVPALQASRPQLTVALRGEVASRMRGGLLRNLLVCAQITVSLILVIGAATMARNGVSVAATDLGFDHRGVFSINQRGESADLIATAADVLGRSSHVQAIAVTSRNPLFGGFPGVALVPSGRAETLPSAYMFVSPEYFSLLQIPLLQGRGFSEVEAREEARVGIVSARAARLFWPGEDPIGRVLRVAQTPEGQNDALAGYTTIAVIGVAKDVVTSMPYEGTDPAMLYLPTSRSGAHAGALLARVGATSAAVSKAMQEELEQVVRRAAAFEVIALTEMTDILLYPLRMGSWIGSVLSLLALTLSICGIYGLLMYVLGHRTHEIGIRMALGAASTDVVWLIVRESARVVLIGGAAGLVFTYVVLKVLDATVSLRLGNVSILDGRAFAAGVVVVATATIVASYFPARRATLVDPWKTLRADG